MMAIAGLATVALVAVVLVRYGLKSDSADDGFTGPSDQPEQAWSDDLDCSTGGNGEAGCDLVATETQFYAIEAPDDDEPATVISFDPETGDRRWSREVGSDAELVAGEGFVVVNSETDGKAFGDSRIDVLEAATGEVRWSKDMGSGNVNLGVQAGHVMTSGNLSSLAAYGAEDGSEVWSREGPGSGCGPWAGTVSGISFGSPDTSDAELEIIDPATGDSIVEVSLAGLTGNTSMDCGDDLLAVSHLGEITGYRLPGGTKLWTVDGDRFAGADETLDVKVMSDVVLVGTPQEMAALSADSGEEVWLRDIEREIDLRNVHDLDDSFLVTARNLTLRSIDDGSITRHVKLPDSAFDVGRSDVLVRHGRKVSAYSLENLEHRWTIAVPKPQDVEFGGGRLFVLSARGEVIAYE